MSNDMSTPITPATPEPPFHGPAFPAPQGWICPRCGASNAPGVMRCACGPCHPSHPGPGDFPPQQPYWQEHPWSIPVGYPVITCCAGGVR